VFQTKFLQANIAKELGNPYEIRQLIENFEALGYLSINQRVQGKREVLTYRVQIPNIQQEKEIQTTKKTRAIWNRETKAEKKADEKDAAKLLKQIAKAEKEKAEEVKP